MNRVPTHELYLRLARIVNRDPEVARQVSFFDQHSNNLFLSFTISLWFGSLRLVQSRSDHFSCFGSPVSGSFAPFHFRLKVPSWSIVGWTVALGCRRTGSNLEGRLGLGLQADHVFLKKKVLFTILLFYQGILKVCFGEGEMPIILFYDY